MKKRKVIILVILTVVVLLSIFFVIINRETALHTGPYNQTLAALMPSDEMSLSYTGTGGYEHKLVVGDLYETEAMKVIEFNGEVVDHTQVGQSQNYGFDLNYKVTSESIVQTIMGDMVMDSEFEEMVIIMPPLEEGNNWFQNVMSPEGKKIRLHCEITGVTDEDTGKTYTVEYKDVDSLYRETRAISEGLGVVAFSKTVSYGGESFDMDYALVAVDDTPEASLNNKIPGTENISGQESVEQGDEGSSETLTSGEAKPESEVSELGSTTSTTERIADEGSDHEADVRAVREVIAAFNEAWVRYSNEGSLDYLDYLVVDSPAYDVLKGFDTHGMDQAFDIMDIGKVLVSGDLGNAWVHEKIRKFNEEETVVVEYHWLYELRKINDQWMIYSYTEKY